LATERVPVDRVERRLSRAPPTYHDDGRGGGGVFQVQQQTRLGCAASVADCATAGDDWRS
jgi:hypothetical protein